MRKPTKIQIKEVWEGCGLHYTEPYWVDDNNNLAFYGETHSELLGNLDLNNLFKYAVPFLIEELATSMASKGAVDLDFCRLWIMTHWLRTWNDNPEDPALALFWTCYPVITGKKVDNE